MLSLFSFYGREKLKGLNSVTRFVLTDLPLQFLLYLFEADTVDIFIYECLCRLLQDLVPERMADLLPDLKLDLKPDLKSDLKPLF